MIQPEYEAALSKFLRSKGVTRCPTACAAATDGRVADADKTALRDHQAIREASRLAKLGFFRQARAALSVASLTINPA